MTSRKTGAFQLRNRLSKTLTSVAVAATGLVAGATMLSGGEAKAFNCTFGLPGATCAPNVWYDSNPVATDKQIKFKQLPTAGSGDIEFKWIDINSNGTWNTGADLTVDQWHVDVDFNPSDLMANDGPSQLDYIIKITDPSLYFWDVTLGSIISPPTGGTVTKQIFQVGPGETKGAQIDGALTDSGMLNLFAIGSYQQLYIVDTAQANPGGSIDAYQNSFRQDVPGPLPILGAAAAFGSSRRLRRRLKATRLA
jgi:hypothetical protein